MRNHGVNTKQRVQYKNHGVVTDDRTKELRRIGRKNWTAEQKAEYNELRRLRDKAEREARKKYAKSEEPEESAEMKKLSKAIKKLSEESVVDSDDDCPSGHYDSGEELDGDDDDSE